MKASGSNNGNGQSTDLKSRWNRVVATLEGKGSQKGLLHHLRTRRVELLDACRIWPDVLLKATRTIVGTKDEPVFARFLEDLDDDCLVNAYGKARLDPKYEHVWELAREAIGKSNLAELIFRFCRLNKSEPLFQLIKSFLAYPHDEIWSCLKDEMESVDQKRKEKALDIITNLVQTFVSFDECPTAYPYGDYDWHLEPEDLQDPRRPLVLSFYPWAFLDSHLGSCLLRQVTKSLDLILVSKRLEELFERKATEEATIRKEIRRMWGELPEKMGRWIVGDGLTEIEIDFGEETERLGLELVTIHPEGKVFPAIEIKTRWLAAGVHFEDTLFISGDGQINLFEWRQKPGMTESQLRSVGRARGLRLVIYYACAKTIYDYACSLGRDRLRRRKNKRSQVERVEGDGEKKIAISPHFPRIGKRGERPSDPNIERCLRLYGYEPPAKRTLQMSPPLHGRQTREDYEPIVFEFSINDI